MNQCTCSKPGYCSRHQRTKSIHQWRKCKTNNHAFMDWEREIEDSVAWPGSRPPLAPLRGIPFKQKPWEGAVTTKPWSYKIAVAIPVLDTPETLQVAIELLRLQTEPPFIMVIDTGSQGEAARAIEELRSTDVEVHSLRLHGVRHPSDFPAMAMDLAFSICRSPYLFATHADCFLRNRDLLKRMLVQCQRESPVVGYEISPRKHPDWRGMFGHTCTMFDMEVMDRIGAGWSMRRLATRFGIASHEPRADRPNWPDTELLLNYLVREHGITPYLIGHEENFVRTKDDNIDHCRSLTGALLYNPAHYELARQWAIEAMNEARERIQLWRASPC